MRTAALTKRARIQSLSRASAIIDVIANSTDGWASLQEISRHTGLNKTTAFNLVASLVALGFVEQDRASKQYRLGLRNLELGRIVQLRLDIPSIARPSLYRLCNRTKETVNLALPYLFEVLIVESIEGSYGVRFTSYTGSRADYHSTACGKAIFAHVPEAVRGAIYEARPLAPITPNTIVEIDALEKELMRVRERGYALDIEENELGAACVAVPIFDGFSEIVAAISVSGPVSRLTKARLTEIAGEVIAETSAISAAMHSSAPARKPANQ